MPGLGAAVEIDRPVPGMALKKGAISLTNLNLDCSCDSSDGVEPLDSLFVSPEVDSATKADGRGNDGIERRDYDWVSRLDEENFVGAIG